MKMLINGMDGLGDNIYQRPFVKMAMKHINLWLRTPWPELYADLGLKCRPSPVKLRTQNKNQILQREWSLPPRHFNQIEQIRYKRNEIETIGMVRSLERRWPHADGTYVMDLPNFGHSPVAEEKPIAIVRPATLRREWLAPARNPRPEYIQQAINILKDFGYYTVSIADCDGAREDGAGEWFDGAEPSGMDRKWHQGELRFTSLMALVQHAAVIVGGVGWIVPAAIAAKKPLYIIFGGRGGHNAPQVIFDKRMDLTKVGFSLPNNFCRCTEAHHGCDKTISAFADQFSRWLQNLTVERGARDGLVSHRPEVANFV